MRQQEEKKKQFVLDKDAAGRLAATCSTFYNCRTGLQAQARLQDLLNLTGPLPVGFEHLRHAFGEEAEGLDDRLDLAAKFGGWFAEMVVRIRTHWLIDDIINLFKRLWTQEKDELCVLC
jgi:hypothetical protein